jgi:hypothetical protein
MSLQWYLDEIRDGFREKLQFIKVAGIIFFCWMAAAIGGSSFGPYLEGLLFPVIVGTDITRAVQQDDGSTIFYGRATKVRACYFDHVDWYWRDGDGEVKINVRFLESPKIRKGGDFAFGPWQVWLSREDLLRETYAIVWHRCHPLGLTATKFYP